MQALAALEGMLSDDEGDGVDLNLGDDSEDGDAEVNLEYLPRPTYVCNVGFCPVWLVVS